MAACRLQRHHRRGKRFGLQTVNGEQVLVEITSENSATTQALTVSEVVELYMRNLQKEEQALARKLGPTARADGL